MVCDSIKYSSELLQISQVYFMYKEIHMGLFIFHKEKSKFERNKKQIKQLGFSNILHKTWQILKYFSRAFKKVERKPLISEV